MSALQKIADAGFVVELVPPDQLDIAPASKLSDAQLQWVRDNKTLLLAELQAANDKPTTWPAFVDECIRQGVTADEVGALFRPPDIDDLCNTVPVSEIPLHAQTIVHAIKVQRRLKPKEPPEDGSRVHVINAQVIQRCATCTRFQRTEHPHIGNCAAGGPEGTYGNWDTDPRDLCQNWQGFIYNQTANGSTPAIAGKKQVSDG